MASLLSVFDPSSFSLLPNWVMIFFIFIFPLYSNLWKGPSIIQELWNVFYNYISVLFSEKNKTDLMFVSLFMTLLIINIFGLFPYGFSISSHFSFNISIGLSLWMATMAWGMKFNTKTNIAHLTPLGCPLILVPFMVFVETIGNIIRPLTLSLRLMANMMAGHMIIGLISKSAFYCFWTSKIVFMVIISGFISFEIGVAFIQAYVFSMLMSLYWKES
uniref:ATP synthase F0 subunit 6 n=1 Tax=Piagetiella africana TaxID=2965260 RepID=UPI00286C3581|nr:ATP synthase F0 subunit 6 [Piagetiella africana]WKF19576.1 ATP synthase subunit 6 [Piagetiella africana]